MEKLIVERSIQIAAPSERVWQALTDPEQLVCWFAPSLPRAHMKRDTSGKITVHLGEMSVDFATLDIAKRRVN